MVGAIATLAASLTVKSGGDTLRLDPGTELRAKVEASLPNNVLRLSVGKATVEVRASGPLPPGTELTLKVGGEPARPQIQLLPDARPQGTPAPPNPAGNTPSNPLPQASPPTGGGTPAQGGAPLPAGGQAPGSVITPETTRQLLQTVARPPASNGAPAQTASQASPSNTPASTAAVRSDLAARAIQSASTPPPTGGQGTASPPSPPAGNPLPSGSSSAPPQPASAQPAPPTGAPPAASGGSPSGPAVSTTAPPPQGAPTPTQTSASPAPPPQGTGSPVQAVASPPAGGSTPAAPPAGSGAPLPANLQAQALGSAPQTGNPAQVSAAAQTQAGVSQAAQAPVSANPATPQPAQTQPAPNPPLSGQPAAPVSTGAAQPSPSPTAQVSAQPAAPQATPAAPAPAAAGGTSPPAGQATPPPSQPATAQPAPPPAAGQATAPTSAPPSSAAPITATGTAAAPSGSAPAAPPSAQAAGSPAVPGSSASAAGLPAGAYSAARTLPTPGLENQSRPIAPQLQKAVDVVLPRLSEQQAGLSGVFAQIGSLMGGTSTAGANLPEPVKQVMQQILGLRLQPQSDGFSGKSVEAAVKNAGLMREAALLGGARAGGTPPPAGDLKSLLMNLKGLLSDLGARSAPLKPLVQPAMPSLKRSPQGERPASSSSILADGDEKALLNRLAQDTDAALSRIRMTQLVNRGLAGDDPAVQGRAMDVTLELPVSVGDQTAVLQMQVGRDPHQDGADEEGEGAWRLRFALDLEETGPMEAAVSLRGGGTFVSLWVDRGETLEAFNANKESLEAAFAHAGLDLRELRFLRGLPRRTEARFGAVVDRQS